MSKVTLVKGVRYYIPADGFMVSGRDGNVEIRCDDLPIPLVEDEFETLCGEPPSYDAVGRGIHQLLRVNPEAAFADRYAALLRDAYPHLLSELASEILMLDHKDVEVPYVDRKINYLKVFTLIEPMNANLRQEIGVNYMERGLRLSALHESTVSMYEAEKHLRRAQELAPDDPVAALRLGEVTYILGRYAETVDLWSVAVAGLSEAKKEDVDKRLVALEEGKVPRVPVIDYLEATGVALELYREGEFEEAAAIINDIIDDEIFWSDFPMPEVLFILGKCYEHLEMPKFAEECYAEVLRIAPDYTEAESALEAIGGKE